MLCRIGCRQGLLSLPRRMSYGVSRANCVRPAGIDQWNPSPHLASPLCFGAHFVNRGPASLPRNLSPKAPVSFDVWQRETTKDPYIVLVILVPPNRFGCFGLITTASLSRLASVALGPVGFQPHTLCSILTSEEILLKRNLESNTYSWVS